MEKHPHDALIHKLEECLEELQVLDGNYELDDTEYATAYDAIDNAIDLVRAIDI